MIMRVKVCASGLKATTRQHGLTEYWANRITHCCAPNNYPRIFCWVYRHEGRKLKHELRCHAVLCSKEKVVQDICNTLKVSNSSRQSRCKISILIKFTSSFLPCRRIWNVHCANLNVKKF